jgi:hypothetical protein
MPRSKEYRRTLVVAMFIQETRRGAGRSENPNIKYSVEQRDELERM